MHGSMALTYGGMIMIVKGSRTSRGVQTFQKKQTTIHIVTLLGTNRLTHLCTARLTQLHLERLVLHEASLLPERPVGGDASTRANHDDRRTGILGHVEGVHLLYEAGDFCARFDPVQPGGADTVVPRTYTIWNTTSRQTCPTSIKIAQTL